MSDTPLLSVQNLSRSFSARILFRGLSFGLFDKERVGLIGPNGAGKSSLLKILAGIEEADQGERAIQKDVQIVYVPQAPRFDENENVEECLQRLLNNPNFSEEEKVQKTAIAINQLGFSAEQKVDTLSGGQQKRLALITAITRQPRILLLDEPTNHLDLDGIRWLEKQLKGFRGAFMMVCHDRSFLEIVCNRIFELNRQYQEGFFSCKGNYSLFLERREAYLISLDQYERSLANKVRREVEWLRQGVKARTTKSKSRIQKAEELQGDLAELRSRKTGQAKIDFTGSQRKTKKLIDVTDISLSFGETQIFEGLSFSLANKTRLGLVGPNGGGKSSLMKVLTKELSPDEGSILWAEDLKVVYFKQDRSTLDFEATVVENLSDSDHVVYRGRSLHVASYAKRFLFSSEFLNLPLKRLSGGEQARLLIAKLMLKEADVLLLDEPTNDLDIETMELLSEALMEFNGALVLVSHDRFFLDQVCSQVLNLEPGFPSQLYADLSQWEAERSKRETPKTIEKKPIRKKLRAKKKLSYNEKREFEQMEEKIMVAEEALDKWKAEIENPNTMASPDKLKEAFEKMSQAQKVVDELYDRWVELEGKQET